MFLFRDGELFNITFSLSKSSLNSYNGREVRSAISLSLKSANLSLTKSDTFAAQVYDFLSCGESHANVTVAILNFLQTRPRAGIRGSSSINLSLKQLFNLI